MLLAIDSATHFLSIALHDGDALLAECTLMAGRKHSALLAPSIEQVMDQIDVGAFDLTALAVSVGPGSYTGTRIGVALAKGMAAVRDLPLVPVTTLETVAAAQSCGYESMPLIVTVSAGRDRVIWAEHRYEDAAWVERRAPQISDWQTILAAYDTPIRVSGEITLAGMQAIKAARETGAEIEVASAAERLRRAGTLAEIAWRRLRESDGDGGFPADRVMPIYLQGPG